MIVSSSSLVLSGAEAQLSTNHPVIGWRNLVTPSAITATYALGNYPASNLANPATNLEWRSTVRTVQYLTITTGAVDPIDYIAVARHNFGSAAIPVSVEGLIGAVWTELVAETMLVDDGPAIFRFTSQSLAQIRIRLQDGIANPRAAVVYCGKSLVLQRKIYVGHTALPDGIKTHAANNRSESGNFLGRIILGEGRESIVPLSLIRPDWFRANMRPFLKYNRDLPFFFAWRPGDYPLEVGFCWLVDDPMPASAGPTNLIAFDMKLAGIA